MTVWSIILAAGQGARLAQAAGGVKKQFIRWRDAPLFWHAARTFARVPRVKGLVFVFPPQDIDAVGQELKDLYAAHHPGLPYVLAAGGTRRQDSVRNGLAVLPDTCTHVLVHDSARPFATASLVAACLDALAAGAGAVIPAIAVTDTIKRVAPGEPGASGALKPLTVLETIPRSALRAVQTPQGFSLPVLREAHAAATAGGWDVTDDASMVEQLGRPVIVIPGEESNTKITTPEDLAMLRNDTAAPIPLTGWGYDVHRYAPHKDRPSRPMKLGGVAIPNAPEIIAHSDGDVLLHALTDALLGLVGAGDIGDRFPDSDPAFENMNSAIFANEALQDVHAAGITITHVDLTIIAQIPKIAPHKPLIRKSIARLLALDEQRVNVKATTEEGLGFTGEKKGIKAVAVVTALAGA